MFIEDGAGPKAADSLLCLRYFRLGSLPQPSVPSPDRAGSASVAQHISQHLSASSAGLQVDASAGERGASFHIAAWAVCFVLLDCLYFWEPIFAASPASDPGWFLPRSSPAVTRGSASRSQRAPYDLLAFASAPADQLFHKPDLILPHQEIASQAKGNAYATFGEKK